jgi:hypothetical protein
MAASAQLDPSRRDRDPMKQSPASDARRKRPPGWFSTTGLKEALARGGCVLCQVLRTSLRRYLFSFLYEGMMSGIVREKFLEGGGFCQQHFWQAKGIEEECWAEGFGIAILCEDLLQRSLKDLELLSESPARLSKNFLKIRRSSATSARRFHLVAGADCIVCAVLKSSEEHYLAVLEELLEEPDFGDRYSHSAGLCLRHLQAAGEHWESKAALELIRTTAQKFVCQLLDELREFQRKHSYQNKHEPHGSEWSSPERAIEFLVGPRADLSGFGELQLTRSKRR